MVEPVSGPTKVEKCGEGCIDVWVGQIGDNYWNATCAFFEASSVYNVVSPDAITDAKLEAVYWDDYIQVFVDGNNIFDTHPNFSHCDAHPPNRQFVMFPFPNPKPANRTSRAVLIARADTNNNRQSPGERM